MASKLTSPGSAELKEFYGARTSWRSQGEEQMRFRKAAALARVSAGSAVLDIGCRQGGLRTYLPRDISYQGMDIAEEFAGDNIIIQDIALGIPFADESFDYIFCIEVLEHVHEPWRALGEMRRVLRPGGAVVLSVPNPYHVKEIIWNVLRIPDRQGHIHSWTRQTMTAFAQMSGFRVAATAGTYLHPPIPMTALLARSIVYRFVKA